MNILKFLISLSFLTATSWAQQQQIPPVADTIQKFISENGLDMSQLTPSCDNFDACAHMNYHVKTYAYNGNAIDAFNKLLSLRPNEIWDGDSRFEMEYDPETQSFLGKNEELPAIKVGQVFFLELGIINQLKIPVAFQVVDINLLDLKISFSYLKQNKSNGIQRITFLPDGPSKFVIVHETRYQSGSVYRDKYLYGIFHTKLINDAWRRFSRKL